MVARFTAGAARLPFMPLRSFTGSDLPRVNPRNRTVKSPYDGEEIAVVPPLRPDTAIVHVQRADESGNAQIWGLLGVQKEAAFAARRVIVVAEEIVEESVIRADPNRTVIPGFIVDAVVHEPFGCHPSYAQGHYDRDNDFYVGWRDIGKDRASLEAWLEEWVYGVDDRAEYTRKLGARARELAAKDRIAPGVNYGY
jgi:glutaconate CoA-transferase subunit A